MNDSNADFEPESPYTPSEAVTMGIAERTSKSMAELPPLYETIDPDALDAVVKKNKSCRVEFEYAGYKVTVDGPQRVSMTELIDENLVIQSDETSAGDTDGRQ